MKRRSRAESLRSFFCFLEADSTSCFLWLYQLVGEGAMTMLLALWRMLVPWPPATLFERGLVMYSRLRSCLGLRVLSPLLAVSGLRAELSPELAIDSYVLSLSSSTLSKQAGLALRWWYFWSSKIGER